MEAVAYSNARSNLRGLIRKVNEDSEVVFITTKEMDEGAVLLSKSDYENLLENAYIRKSQPNVEFIQDQWKQAKAGLGKEHNWQ
ncbi:type II toxin-antitoxin system Phd/YefM family antitoxin [Lactococcus lactis]|jgi:antitoxin YefM|uniref:Antitoxin n=2 Tax=Lactococcus lactis subsp. hordniae TaxID=203404 RepID=A0A5M9PZY7_LACLH|nr:type II toxin-antitoxin system prevent-host-death family antitoxin [Lactococcus lactis]KAA8700937.1 type II toxin-antitoxin system prevent-host-death family antitoxin [Lactococcus lactis subsp. hordniae]MCT3135181.1 type II toxin-antitoxin system prevent-host-death family antitoxin [Lactococcus lactis]MDR0289054.1 type II toxin-antitoxin system prevent-host-death family antitoxin [Rickettsiales bacterium]